MGTFQQYLFMGYSRRLGVSLLGLLGYERGFNCPHNTLNLKGSQGENCL